MTRWLPVPAAPLYEVSDVGEVRSNYPSLRRRSADGTLIQHTRGKLKKYRYVNLYVAGKLTGRSVHSLVCEAFHGPKPTPAHEVAHGDGDPSNNTASNLRWATRTENARDKILHGTVLTCETHNMAILTWDDVRVIRGKYAEGATQQELADTHGVSQSEIGLVIAGVVWKDDAYTPPKKRASKTFLDASAQREVVELFTQLKSQEKVAESLGISQSYVSKILRQNTHGPR